MRFIPLSAILLIATTLTGCFEKAYTAEYLLQDQTKLAEVYSDCQKNKQSEENCKNARLAMQTLAAQKAKADREAKEAKLKNDYHNMFHFRANESSTAPTQSQKQ